MLTFKAAKAGLFVFFCLPFSLFAATRNWTGTTNGNWSVAANWGGTAPSAGDDLVFDNATNANALNNDYPAGTAFHSLTFNAPGTFSPDGNSILLGTGGITVTAGTTLNDFIPVTLAVSQTWNANGPLVLNGPANLTLGSNTLTMTGSGSHLFSGNTISGTGGITLGGSLTLQFSGHMNYIGPTIAGGTAHLVLGTPNNVNTPITINSGAFLDDSLGFPAFLLAPLTINSGGTYEVIINGAGFGNFTSMTANDAPVTLGGNLALTNTVSNPAGTVFTIIRNQTGSAVAGTFAGLPEGATIVSGGQSFVISYVGGSGKDVTLTAQAPPTSTTTSVVGAPNPSALNQNVQFTVNVTPNAAVGSVALNDGATNLNNGVLSGGSVVFDISSLSVGSHNITAVYGGGAGFMGSTSPIFVQVVSAPLIATNTSLNSTLNPSTVGQSVTFTATVAPAATGNVSFFDGATPLGTIALNGSSQAAVSTSALTLGSHNITATYNGDATHSASTSPILVQVVSSPLIATNTSLNSTLNPSAVGQSVTFTATVAPAATGNVSFFDGATPLGTVALNGSGQAALSTSALTLGTHNITATYNGDATHSASTSPNLVQVVSAAASPIPTLDARSLAALAVLLGVIGATLNKR